MKGKKEVLSFEGASFFCFFSGKRRKKAGIIKGFRIVPPFSENLQKNSPVNDPSDRGERNENNGGGGENAGFLLFSETLPLVDVLLKTP